MSETNYAVVPGEYFLEWCEDRYLSIDDAAVTMGYNPKVLCDFVSGKLPVTPAFAQVLEQYTSIPAQTWIKYQHQYEDDLNRITVEIVVPWLCHHFPWVSNLPVEEQVEFAQSRDWTPILKELDSWRATAQATPQEREAAKNPTWIDDEKSDWYVPIKDLDTGDIVDFYGPYATKEIAVRARVTLKECLSKSLEVLPEYQER